MRDTVEDMSGDAIYGYMAPEPAHEDAETTRSQTRSAMTWAQRSRRVFAIDISRCPRCGPAE